MANYGINDRLNVIAGLPYVTTRATAGTLAGMNGFQDLTASVKWMPVETKLGKGLFSFYGIGSIVLPLNDYVADFLPMSIGLHCKSFMARAMVDYQLNSLFFTGSGQYINRSNITIDRNTYYTTRLIYSNEVAMPDGAVFNFRTGYRSQKLIAEAILESGTTLGGFDIRKNDMPFPSNKMNSTTAGVNFKYSMDFGLEFTGGANYVVAGRNVGQSSMVHAGVYYLFDIGKKTKETKKEESEN
nr:transporter [Hufsiella arboris]